MIIYKVTNIVNDKVYIGLTIRTLSVRKSQHVSDSKRHTYNSYFHSAIRKYGIESFKWEIIASAASKTQLKKLEISKIAEHNSNNCKFGYNLTIGGDGVNGLVFTDEQKLNISKSKIGKYKGKNNPFYGKHHTPETKKLLSDQRKGLNTGDKNYFYDKHYIGKENPFYGNKHKDSTKKMIGDANSGKYKVTTQSGKTFIIKNLREFCRENHLHYNSAKMSMWRSKWYKTNEYFFQRLLS